MYVVELQFECFDNTTVSAVDKAINGLMDALRYNGQVLGREFPIVMGDGEFFVRVSEPVNHIYGVPTDALCDPNFYREVRDDPILVFEPNLLSVSQVEYTGHLRIHPKSILIFQIIEVRVVRGAAERMHGCPSVV